MPEKLLKLLIYGPSGRGKTYLAKTAVGDTNLMPMLLLDFEGGAMSSISSVCRYISLDQIGENVSPIVIDVYRINSWSDFDKIYEYLETGSVYKTVFFDSLSEMNKFNLFEQTGAYSSARKSLSAIKPPKIQDYGNSHAQINFLVRYFRDLQMNVIFTAGATYKENPATGRDKLFPDMTGQLAAQIPHAIPLVGFLARIDNDNGSWNRAVLFDSSEQYEAKAWDEFGHLVNGVIDPTLPKIYNLFNGWID